MCRRAGLLAISIMILMTVTAVVAVPPATASATCPGSTGVNRVDVLSNPQSVRGGMAPGSYLVFSDPCVAQARATGLNNIANNQNYCIAFGTAASGSGGLAGITSAIAGTAAVSTAVTIFAPLVAIGGVFTIGACLAVQQVLNSMASHVRGAAQACGTLGIVYEFRSNLGPDGANVASSLRNIRCQNPSGGVGDVPPAVPGLNWDDSNGPKLVWGGAPKRANLPKSGGHGSVCGGGVSTGTEHYVDIPSTSAAVDWVYLSRKLVSRAPDGSSATYTVMTWSKTTGLYESARTTSYDCYKANTPASVSQCVQNQTLYYSPDDTHTSYSFLRRESVSNVMMKSKWNHVTGLYDLQNEYYISCWMKRLEVTASGDIDIITPYFEDTGVFQPLTAVATVPPDSTVVFTSVPHPFYTYNPSLPSGCDKVITGGLEEVTTTVYSSFPGYPKTIDVFPIAIRGTQTDTFVENPDYPATCYGRTITNYTVDYTLT